MRWWYGPGLLCVCLLLGGCARGGDVKEKPVEIKGTVKLDGKPMPEGEIVFEGEPGSIPEILTIKDGDFSGKVKPGKKQVKVNAFKISPPPPSATGDNVEDQKVNIIPDRYNAKTTLKADVSEGGLSPSEFQVLSK